MTHTHSWRIKILGPHVSHPCGVARNAAGAIPSPTAEPGQTLRELSRCCQCCSYPRQLPKGDKDQGPRAVGIRWTLCPSAGRG